VEIFYNYLQYLLARAPTQYVKTGLGDWNTKKTLKDQFGLERSDEETSPGRRAIE
jgi:hypothetical protein